MDGCFCRLIIRIYGENCDPPESFSVNDILTSLSDTFYDRFAQKTLLFFVENGWDDEYGGLFEVLKSNGESKAIPFRRVMVHARQLFVFSRWAKLTGNNKFSAKADKIFEFMITAFWDFENGGWFSKLNLDGSVQNQTKDLYAHAFVLFGLANYKNSLDRKTAHDWIDKTLTIIERQFSRKDGSFCQDLSGDFVDLSPQIRSQNPHMHLLEAALYLLENDKQNSRYLTLVNRLLNLFESKILDSENKLIREYLDQSFKPKLVNSFIIEPGHHYEWAWLLNWSDKIHKSKKYDTLTKTLFDTGWRLGWDFNNGGVFDEFDCENKQVFLSTKRLWPLLELIKVLSVLPNNSYGDDLTSALTIVLERYIQPNGTWVERFDQNWCAVDTTMPTSSIYHMAMTISVLEARKTKK